MKLRRIVRGLGIALLFLLALHLSARWLGLVLYCTAEREAAPEAGWTGDFASYYFSGEKRDSIDTVFIGSSHQFCSVDVNLLNRQYGENAALLTSSSQVLRFSYFAALAAIELQHPKRIVLEASYASSSSEGGVGSAGFLMNNLPNWSRAKFLLAREFPDPYRYYYPIIALHNGWYHVQREDLLPARLSGGERFRHYYTKITLLEPWELIDREQTAPMPEKAEEWLDKIVALCRDNDIELILYIAPYKAPEDEQAIFNGLNDYAREHDLRYRNMLYDMEAMGLDLEQDFLDTGHLNCTGQEKLTRFLAQTLLGAET